MLGAFSATQRKVLDCDDSVGLHTHLKLFDGGASLSVTVAHEVRGRVVRSYTSSTAAVPDRECYSGAQGRSSRGGSLQHPAVNLRRRSVWSTSY